MIPSVIQMGANRRERGSMAVECVMALSILALIFKSILWIMGLCVQWNLNQRSYMMKYEAVWIQSGSQVVRAGGGDNTGGKW